MENHKEKLRTIIEEYWRKELPKTKERKTVSPKIKSTKRTKTERKDKVRNNNGGRKTTKGRSR